MIEVKLPQAGMGMSEGTVVEWLKREGDPVEADEVIALVEAAKATVDIIAPATGWLSRIAVAAQETVPVHSVLAEIEPA